MFTKVSEKVAIVTPNISTEKLDPVSSTDFIHSDLKSYYTAIPLRNSPKRKRVTLEDKDVVG